MTLMTEQCADCGRPPNTHPDEQQEILQLERGAIAVLHDQPAAPVSHLPAAFASAQRAFRDGTL